MHSDVLFQRIREITAMPHLKDVTMSTFVSIEGNPKLIYLVGVQQFDDLHWGQTEVELVFTDMPLHLYTQTEQVGKAIASNLLTFFEHQKEQEHFLGVISARLLTEGIQEKVIIKDIVGIADVLDEKGLSIIIETAPITEKPTEVENTFQLNEEEFYCSFFNYPFTTVKRFLTKEEAEDDTYSSTYTNSVSQTLFIHKDTQKEEKGYSAETDAFIEDLTHMQVENLYEQKINKALEENDKETFMSLTEELNNYRKTRVYTN